MKSAIAAAAALLAASCLPAGAAAAGTSQLEVSASVVSRCWVRSADPNLVINNFLINFRQLDPTGTFHSSGSAQIYFDCNSNERPSLVISGTVFPFGADKSTGEFHGTLRSPGHSATIPYSIQAMLFPDPRFPTSGYRWFVDFLGLVRAGNANKPPGTYTDTVTVTLGF